MADAEEVVFAAKGDNVASNRRSFGGLCVGIALLLAVPIIPFAIFGEAAEQRFTSWLHATLSPGEQAMLVIGLLATDVLLPVPSSVVATFSGTVLGFWGGTIASWCGMTAGAVAAFGLVRIFGRPLARRLTTPDELSRVDVMVGRVGIFVLVLARPIPVLAEASVLLMGMTGLSLWRFCLAVGLSNLGIAAAYAALGSLVTWPVAVMASIALPIFIGGLARLLCPTPEPQRPTVEPHFEEQP